eukprot:TRINITY_DN4304_c0_g2_i1.p1 TRINITY_DN4304_c0_g2~~TRINITY_DN4304_c0_g2_i1.p1  ORF type:complete len:1100 (-),score=241.30 TRINITY_DN4304_c0_g2_i1:2731-6030(-)
MMSFHSASRALSPQPPSFSSLSAYSSTMHRPMVITQPLQQSQLHLGQQQQQQQQQIYHQQHTAAISPPLLTHAHSLPNTHHRASSLTNPIPRSIHGHQQILPSKSNPSLNALSVKVNPSSFSYVEAKPTSPTPLSHSISYIEAKTNPSGQLTQSISYVEAKPTSPTSLSHSVSYIETKANPSGPTIPLGQRYSYIAQSMVSPVSYQYSSTTAPAPLDSNLIPSPLSSTQQRPSSASITENAFVIQTDQYSHRSSLTLPQAVSTYPPVSVASEQYLASAITERAINQPTETNNSFAFRPTNYYTRALSPHSIQTSTSVQYVQPGLQSHRRHASTIKASEPANSSIQQTSGPTQLSESVLSSSASQQETLKIENLFNLPTPPSFYDPRSRAKFYMALGSSYSQASKDKSLALAAYQQATKEDPGYSLAHYNYAVTLQEQSRYNEAATEYEAALQLDPRMIDAHNNLGLVYAQLKRPADESIVCYHKCLALQPSHTNAWVNLGDAHKAKNELSEAAMAYQNALSLRPNSTTALRAMGDFLKETGRPAESIHFYMQIISINPLSPIGYTCVGHALHHLSRLPEAIANYQRALQLDPKNIVARNYLGNGFKDSGKHPEAVVEYKKVLEVEPCHPAALANMVHSQLFISDWTDREEILNRLKKVMYDQIEKGETPFILPFHAVGYPFDEKEMYALARAHGKALEQVVDKYRLKVFPPSKIPEGKKIRLGYVSSDFANHPLSHLMQSIFGLHNRSKFEVYCYALTPDDGSDWRKKIMTESDSFVDISSMPFDFAAQRIHSDGIHVLFNLNGYTKGSRNEIFVLRPAPIQALYMGFPGTSGMDCIDYMFADEVAVPTEDQPYYSEKLVQMPHSYFVNDHRNCFNFILDESQLPTRQQVDPAFNDNQFIFCNLNQLYKFDPETFACWCRILKRVPHAIMWLLRFPAEGELSIRRLAAENGVDPARFIFTNTMKKADYIRKSTIADMFLDTPECNGHTTGTDALWCGVPFLTMPLRKMASRVGASLLNSLEIPELIVKDYFEYEELAVSIANDPIRHKMLKEKVKTHRLTKPLFDTALWVREFEAGIEMIVENHRAGNPPKTTIVPQVE